jgi:hypothetical protein
MNLIKKVAIYFAVLFLMACSSQAISASNPQATPSITAVPSKTSIPTVTATPTSTPVFNYPASWDPVFETLTPIATPQQPQNGFHLKEWSESDAIALIKTMDKYARDYDIPGPSSSRGYYIGMQSPIEILLKETLLHFPNSPNAELYKWHLALVQATLGKHDSDEWMVAKVEQALQSGAYTPETLDEYVSQYGFSVAENRENRNVCGDNKPAWVQQISIASRKKWDGLFIVICQSNDNAYKVHLLDSRWYFDHGYSTLSDIDDFNANNLDEIVVKLGSHSGTMCGYMVKFFEWRDGQFVDLTQGKVRLPSCGTDWKVTSDTIQIVPGFKGEIPMEFSWNGKFYEFSGIYGVSSIWERWKYLNDARSRAYLAIENYGYDEEADLLKEIIATSQSLNKGSAYPDYLRYRLGVVYALQSKHEEAVKEFEELELHPFDSTHSLSPRVARLFLDIYKDDASLYRACLSANRLLEGVVPYLSGALLVQQGVLLDWSDFGAMPLCDLEDAFHISANSWSIEGNLLQRLDQNGVEINSFYKTDINSDGNDEWFVKLDGGFWVLAYKQGDGYNFQRLPELYGGLPKIDEVLTFRGEKHNSTFLFIRSDRDWWAYKVEDDFKISLLDWWLGADRFEVQAEDGIPVLQLSPTTLPSWVYPWEGYRWDSESSQFKPDLLEYELFVRKDFSRSVEVSQRVYDIVSNDKTGRLHSEYDRIYYLTALSSELAGDVETAAGIYWQLWRDFPGSPYALMAKEKLEFVP